MSETTGSRSSRPGEPGRPDSSASSSDARAVRDAGVTQALPVVPGGPPPPAQEGARGTGTARPSVPRPSTTRSEGRSAPAAARGPRTRRARLALRRIEPWSAFLFSFLGSIGLGIVLLVAVVALYAMLSALGVVSSINDVFSEINPGGGPDSALGGPLLTLGRALGLAAVLAAVNVVLLTTLATLGALLYNTCASFTGGIELTLAEKD